MSKKRKKKISVRQKKEMKKYGPRFIKFGHGITVDVNDLMNEVNAFDKSFGFKLKNKKAAKANEPKAMYKIQNKKLQTFLAFMIATSNGIDIDRFYAPVKFGQKRRKMEITPEEFREYSKLGWKNKNARFDVKSKTFKRRFLSLVLLHLKTDIKPAIDRKWRYNRSKVCEEEWRYLYLERITRDTVKFCINVLNSKTYKNSILKLLFDMNYSVPNLKVKMQNSAILHYMRNMDAVKKDTITRKPFLEEDAGMILLLRAALCLSCNSTNIKKLWTLDDIEGATASEDMIELLRKAGKRICKLQDKYGVPLMFRAFNDAKPLIYTTYYKESSEDKYLNMGIRACVFVGFICNDKEIDMLIERLINYYPPRERIA